MSDRSTRCAVREARRPAIPPVPDRWDGDCGRSGCQRPDAAADASGCLATAGEHASRCSARNRCQEYCRDAGNDGQPPPAVSVPAWQRLAGPCLRPPASAPAHGGLLRVVSCRAAPDHEGTAPGEYPAPPCFMGPWPRFMGPRPRFMGPRPRFMGPSRRFTGRQAGSRYCADCGSAVGRSLFFCPSRVVPSSSSLPTSR